MAACTRGKRLGSLNFKLSLISSSSLSAPFQVFAHDLLGHSESAERGERQVAVLLEDGVRVCRCEHAAPARHLSGKRSAAGPAALHHRTDSQLTGPPR